MKDSLRLNYIFTLLNRVVILLTPLLLTPYITRVLGAEELGKFSYANTIASYFVMFSMMGMNIYGNREIAISQKKSKNRISEEYTSLRFIQIFNTLVLCVLYVVYVLLFCEEIFAISIIQILYILSALFDITWFMSGIQQFKKIALRNIFINLVATACIFLFVNSVDDLIYYAIIKTGSILLSQIILNIACNDKPDFVKFDRIKIIGHYKQLVIFFLPVVIESVLHGMDRIMLGIMVSYSAVGLYYSSRMVTDLPQCMVTSINTIMYPKITSMNVYKGTSNESKELFQVVFFMVNALCIGLCFGIISVSNNFVNIFFGSDYYMCAVYIPLLTPYIFIAAWNNTIRYQYLLPMKKDKIYIKAIIYGIVVNLFLNIIFIKFFDVKGAIFATILAESVTAFIQTNPIRKEIEVKQRILECIPLLCIGLIMMVLVKKIESILMFNLIIDLILNIFIGIIIYVSLLMLYIYLFKKDFIVVLKKYK